MEQTSTHFNNNETVIFVSKICPTNGKDATATKQENKETEQQNKKIKRQSNKTRGQTEKRTDVVKF